MNKLYIIGDKNIPTIEQIGGKALSLFKCSNAGFKVPIAATLSTTFFKPWIEKLKLSKEWKIFSKAEEKEYPEMISSIKTFCKMLKFSDDQRVSFNELLGFIEENKLSLMAVRSSSPEEDLAGASFAGIYETVLGVNKSTLEDAIKTCFTSAFDERVIHYKKQRGYNVFDPKIAIIIQKQLASEISGVAFSLNPITNSYDDVVINSNYGLGMTVVDGTISPDQFTVSKVDRSIDRIIGSKKKAIYLNTDGGTYTKQIDKTNEYSLTDEQVLEIHNLTCKTEEIFDKFMDIEWAYEDKKLYLLQARPITGHIQLPKIMITKIGERKKIYQDVLLSEQGLVDNLSPLGSDFFDIMMDAGMAALGADEKINRFETGLTFSAGGRMYSNISNMTKLIGKKTVLNTIRHVDEVGADILEGIDLKKEYGVKGIFPPAALLKNVLKMAFGGIKMLRAQKRAYKKPKDFLKLYMSESENLLVEMNKEFVKEQSYGDLVDNLFDMTLKKYGVFVSLPAIFAGQQAYGNIKNKILKDLDVGDNLHFMVQSLPHNITIEMGLLLFEMSKFTDVQDEESVNEFLSKLERNELSPEFTLKWKEFMLRFGMRYPGELEIATPRYYEKPDEVFKLLKTLNLYSNPELSPQGIFDAGKVRRMDAVKYIRGILNGDKRKLDDFNKNYSVVEAFYAYREFPKYYLVLVFDFCRRKLISLADKWVKAGRLEIAEDVFNLKYDEVIEAEKNPSLDLNSLIHKNKAYYKQFDSKSNPPIIIDSRGFIPQLVQEITEDGSIVGVAASPGIVKGPVKILTKPDEKPIFPGEILVARATDPGWTTLFLNAAGILIENGGTLQHGASVARESSKPCIVALNDITKTLKDGQIVEMNGSTGILKIIN